MNIISIDKVNSLFKYFNDPFVANLLVDFNNKRTDYIKILLKRGEQHMNI